ncbi:MAG TPA: MauE/DoxX family redox-associated membrane protein [Candidatus Didemnitutus sp.]|jgi:uncharacterized membrane protein YphA (DoxX/SURF4 family)
MKSVRLILRLVLGAVFVWAAVTKIADPRLFVAEVSHFHLLPYPMAVALGIYLPWLELVCGLATAFGWRLRAALGLILALTCVFLVALGSAWWRHLDISCGCFGSEERGSLGWDLARDGTLAVVAGFLLATMPGAQGKAK